MFLGCGEDASVCVSKARHVGLSFCCLHGLVKWNTLGLARKSCLFVRALPFGRRGMPSASGISPHAKGTLFEYLQPQGRQLNVLLPLDSLPVLRVCACSTIPPPMPCL